MKYHCHLLLSKTLAIMLFFSPIAYAKPSDALECPASIKVSQTLLEMPSGWRLFQQDSPHYLSSIEIFDGPPEEHASLKPDRQSDQTATWSFQGKSIHYIVCRYSYTTIQLTRALPTSVKRCSVSYNAYQRTEGGSPLPDKLLCM
jgi:hypothetical protein